MTLKSWMPYQNQKTDYVLKPRKKNETPTEEVEQIRFVAWLRNKKIRFASFPNGRTSAREGARYKALGQSPGMVDLIIPYISPSKGYGGLYIEMKRVKGGVVSPEQKEWLEWLNANGSFAVVCKGFEEAKKVVEAYFGWGHATD
jgi:hypothetical protein